MTTIEHDNITQELNRAVENAEDYAAQVGNTIEQIQAVKVNGKAVSINDLISEVEIADSENKLEEIRANLIKLQGGEKTGFFATLGKFLPFIKDDSVKVSNAKELIEQIDEGIREKIAEAGRIKPVLESFSQMLSDRHNSLAKLVSNLEENKAIIEEQIQQFTGYLNQIGTEHPDYLNAVNYLERLKTTKANLEQSHATATTTRTHILAQSTLLNEASRNQESALVILKNTQQFTLRTMQDSLVIKAISDKTANNLNAIEATQQLASNTLNLVTQGVIENSQRISDMQNKEHDTKEIENNIKELERLIEQRKQIDAKRKDLLEKQVNDSKALLEKLSTLLKEDGVVESETKDIEKPVLNLKG